MTNAGQKNILFLARRACIHIRLNILVQSTWHIGYVCAMFITCIPGICNKNREIFIRSCYCNSIIILIIIIIYLGPIIIIYNIIIININILLLLFLKKYVAEIEMLK